MDILKTKKIMKRYYCEYDKGMCRNESGRWVEFSEASAQLTQKDKQIEDLMTILEDENKEVYRLQNKLNASQSQVEKLREALVLGIKYSGELATVYSDSNELPQEIKEEIASSIKIMKEALKN